MNKKGSYLALTVVVSWFAALSCASTPKMPDPKKVTFSEPAAQGKYALPYRSDGNLAGWVERAKDAKKKCEAMDTGKSVAKGVASHFLGGLEKVATDVATEAAAAAAKKIIEETIGEFDTDQFFDDECDYSYYLYAKYSQEKDYNEVLNLVFFVFEPIQKKYQTCLQEYLKRHPESAPDKK